MFENKKGEMWVVLAVFIGNVLILVIGPAVLAWEVTGGLWKITADGCKNKAQELVVWQQYLVIVARSFPNTKGM